MLSSGFVTNEYRKNLSQCEDSSFTLPSPVASNIDDVGYITDIEGDLDTWENYVRSRESVLFRGDDGHLKLKSETSGFVFGGDLFDRGKGDLRVARDLLRLKKRYPDRVVLIMGNRDINKMRFSAELDPRFLGQNATEHAFGAWWDRKAPTLSEHLLAQNLSDTRVNRLRWMLQHTLGSPGAFEYRRQELAELTGTPINKISDENVVESFVGAVKDDNGVVNNYLRSAQIGVIIGDTLFVHGAVEEQALGFVPSPLTRYKFNARDELKSLPGAQAGLPLREWIDGLNAFAAEQVASWRKDPFWHEDGTRAGEALMAYQCRPAIAFMTVVVTCYVDGKNMPTRKAIDIDKFEGYPKCSDPLSSTVQQYLMRGGVRRIVVGHKPSGDAAALLRVDGPDNLGFEVISADTNYASTETQNLRGGSWCEVRLSFSAHDAPSQARLRGSLADGRGEYDFTLPAIGRELVSKLRDPAKDSGDEIVGRQTSDGWWVRARLGETEPGERGEVAAQYLLSRGHDRHAEYRLASPDDIEVEAVPPALLAHRPEARL